MKILYIILVLNLNLFANLYTINYENDEESTLNTQPIDATSEEAKEMYNKAVEKKKNEPRNVELNNIDSRYFDPLYIYKNFQLSCPSMRSELYKNSSYSVIVEDINFKTSSIKCSVVDKYNSKKYETKIFTNPLHKQFLNQNLNDGVEYLNDDAVELSLEYSDRLSYIKDAFRIKYSKNHSASDIQQSYLDTADLLDALLILDDSIIDLEQTYLGKKLVLREGYELAYKKPELAFLKKEQKDELNRISKSISSQFGFDSFKIFQEKTSDELLREQTNINEYMVKSYSMIIEFFIKIYPLVNGFLFQIFLIAILLYAFIQSSVFLFQSYSDTNQSNYYIKMKIATALLSGGFIIFFFQDSISLKIEDGEKTYELNSNKIQSLVRYLSQESNKYSDTITEGLIGIQTNYLFDDSYSSLKEIKTTVSRNRRLLKLRENSIKFNDKCLDTFNTVKLSSHEWFKHTDMRKNPFIPDDILFKNSNYTYTDFIKNKTKFDTQSITLNSCYNNAKSLNIITEQIKYNILKIDAFNSLDYQEDVYKRKELIIESIYQQYYENGYLAAAFIPIFDSYERFIDVFTRNVDKYKQILFSFDIQQATNTISENSFLVFLFGEGIIAFFKSIFSIFTNSTVGLIPFVGDNLSSATSSLAAFTATTIVVDIVDELIPVLRNFFMFLISTVMFFIYFISKFFAFWILPFILLYALASNSFEQVSKKLIKVIITFLKPILFCVFLFFSTYIVNFSYEFCINLLSGIKDFLSFNDFMAVVAYFLYGLLKFLTLILSIYLAYYMLVKAPNAIFSFFELKADDFADAIGDNISNVIENKVIK